LLPLWLYSGREEEGNPIIIEMEKRSGKRKMDVEFHVQLEKDEERCIYVFLVLAPPSSGQVFCDLCSTESYKRPIHRVQERSNPKRFLYIF